MSFNGYRGPIQWRWLALASLLAAQVNAQEPAAPLSLDQAMRLALEQNPSLTAARREVGAAEGQLLQGSLRPNPEFTYQADDARKASRTSTFELGVPIEVGGKRDARIRAATQGREVAQADLGSAELRVRSAVIAAFFDVLTAQALLTASEDSVKIAQRATDIAAKRVQAGKVSPVEETRARVAEASARIALAQAASELRNARRRLASLWGNATPEFTEASGDAEQMPRLLTEEEVAQRLASSPQLQRAQRELERRKALVTLEQSRALPDVTVSVGMKRSIEVPGDQALIALKVPLPLFNRNQGNLQEALQREEKAAAELQAARVALSGAARQALENVGARRQEAELLRTEVVPGARSAFEAASVGFENGKFSFLEVLDAQRTLIAATSQYLNALAGVHRANSELESLIGSGSDAR